MPNVIAAGQMGMSVHIRSAKNGPLVSCLLSRIWDRSSGFGDFLLLFHNNLARTVSKNQRDNGLKSFKIFLPHVFNAPAEVVPLEFWNVGLYEVWLPGPEQMKIS